jgi:hypothetical protein
MRSNMATKELTRLLLGLGQTLKLISLPLDSNLFILNSA